MPNNCKVGTDIHDFFIIYCSLHSVITIVQRILPWVQEEHEPELARGVLGEGLSDGDKVLQRLGHLTAADSQVTGVEKVPHPVIIVILGLVVKNSSQQWYNSRQAASLDAVLSSSISEQRDTYSIVYKMKVLLVNIILMRIPLFADCQGRCMH